MRQAFGILLRSELALLRASMGDLVPQARRAIREAGERAIDEAARRLGEAIDVYDLAGNTPGETVEFQGRQVCPEAIEVVNPGVVIRAALAAALEEQVGPERAAAPLDTFARREKVRRRRIIGSALLPLDLELHLSAAQWEAIERDLLDGWDERLAVLRSPFFRTEAIDRLQSWPGVRYDRVLPHLDPRQRARLGESCDRDLARARIGAWLRNWQWSMIPDAQTLVATEDPWWRE